jgi:hypothetical protein
MSKESQTIEIFAEDDESGLPLAFAMDPDNTNRERFRLILKAQIERPDPKAFFCNIGGVYDEISSEEFLAHRENSKVNKQTFIEELITVFKGPYTSDIIISNPPLKP